MMEAWRKIRLGDACKTNADSYSSKEGWDFVNYLDTGNIINNRIDAIQYIDVKCEKLPSRARRKVKNGSIIYSMVRPNQRHFGIIKSQPKNFLVSTGFAVIDVDASVLDSDFLYYLLTQASLIEVLHAIAEQSVSAYPSIKASDIEDLEIEIPDLVIQKKIADVLCSLDRKITQNVEINKNLEEQARAIFKNWFIDLTPFSTDGSLPLGWRGSKVNEIVEFHDAKRIPLSNAMRVNMEKIYPYYGATSCMDYVDDYIFEGTYLLLGEDGTVIDKNGFPILQYVDGKFWVNNHAHILTGKTGFSVEWLYLMFSMTKVDSIVTGAVQPKISQSNLKKIALIIPPFDVLSSFDRIIQPMFVKLRNNRLENMRLAELRDFLLPRLMSGEIDVSDIAL
ncbi:restriction endonuclease subunit S [Selenomonas noxia]|nr:restriction endonuclease subunit S [Selenomonas noxia]